jgi:hypothetical protein
MLSLHTQSVAIAISVFYSHHHAWTYNHYAAAAAVLRGAAGPSSGAGPDVAPFAHRLVWHWQVGRLVNSGPEAAC